MCLFMSYSDKIFLSTVNGWCICSLWNRSYLFYHISNEICIFYNYLICLLFAKIIKFPQHFISCTKIERRLGIVLKSVSGLKDFSEYSIVLVYEMNVTGRNYRNSKFFTKCDNFLIVLLEFFFVPGSAVL